MIRRLRNNAPLAIMFAVLLVAAITHSEQLYALGTGVAVGTVLGSVYEGWIDKRRFASLRSEVEASFRRHLDRGPIVLNSAPTAGSPEERLRADVDELAGRYQLNATGEITIRELGRRAESALEAARLDERERLSARVYENGWCPTCAAPARPASLHDRVKEPARAHD